MAGRRYVHIGESHRGYLGTGSVDFQGLFRGLAAIDYAGPLTFESFSSAVVSPSLSNTLCVWRNLYAPRLQALQTANLPVQHTLRLTQPVRNLPLCAANLPVQHPLRLAQPVRRLPASLRCQLPACPLTPAALAPWWHPNMW